MKEIVTSIPQSNFKFVSIFIFIQFLLGALTLLPSEASAQNKPDNMHTERIKTYDQCYYVEFKVTTAGKVKKGNMLIIAMDQQRLNDAKECVKLFMRRQIHCDKVEVTDMTGISNEDYRVMQNSRNQLYEIK